MIRILRWRGDSGLPGWAPCDHKGKEREAGGCQGSRGWRDRIAGLEDGREPGANEYRQMLEVRTGKETDFLLPSPQGTQIHSNFDFRSLDL